MGSTTQIEHRVNRMMKISTSPVAIPHAFPFSPKILPR